MMNGAAALNDPRVVVVAVEDENALPAPDGEADVFPPTRTVVVMEIDEPTTQSVVGAARAIYDGIRLHGGLSSGSGSEQVGMTPMNRLLMFDPSSGEFFQIAENLYDQGNYLYSVVAAQTAFELYMEGVFEYVLHLRSTVEIGKAIGDLIRSYNLNDRKTRRLWESFTGHRVTKDALVWEAYQDHLERRHKLVHRGEFVVTKDKAAASLKAVDALATQIAAVVIRLMPQHRAQDMVSISDSASVSSADL